MKQIILFSLLLLPFCIYAQVLESFDGPNLNTANSWRADSAGFYIDNGKLCFDASGRNKGVHYIKLDIMYGADMEWEFDVSFLFSPTASNHARAYVYATGLTDNQLFYVQIGGADRNVMLYRIDASGQERCLIKGRVGLLSDNTVSVCVRLTLKNESVWTLYTKRSDETYFRNEGQFESLLQDIREKGVFNLACRYQAKSYKNYITMFDNIKIDRQLTENPDGGGAEDTVLPELKSVEYSSGYVLSLLFDKPVDISEAEIELAPLGKAYRISYADSENKERLNVRFESALEENVSYTLSCSRLKTETGVPIPEIREPVFVESVADEDYALGSVLINEVMADPTGLKELPETEYIELRNCTDQPVQLKGWKLVYGTSEKEIPYCLLPADGYAVCYRNGREIYVAPSGFNLSMSDFPSALANEGKSLALLSPLGKTIDQITYDKAKAGKSWERLLSGWELCAAEAGGTPGAVNSMEENKDEDPDLEIPEENTGEIAAGDIIINELLIDPPTGGSEYIELYNRSDQKKSLNQLSVAIRKNDGALSTPYSFANVQNVLAPGEYVALTKSRYGVSDYYSIQSEQSIVEVARLPVLANTTSTVVLLKSKDQTIIDEVSYTAKWHAYFVKQTKGVSLERISPDGQTQDGANWSSALETVGSGTPGYQNSIFCGNSSGNATNILEVPQLRPSDNTYFIRYELDKPGYACKLYVYNLSGICVSVIGEHQLTGLTGELSWNGSSSKGNRLAMGIYIFYAELYHPQGDVRRIKRTFLVK